MAQKVKASQRQAQKKGGQAVAAGSRVSKQGASKTPIRSAASPTKKAVKPERPGLLPSAHGAEIYAALAVREKNYSRFKGFVIIGLLLICIFSLAWNSVQNWTRPEPKLLAVTTDGRFQPLPLLDEPLENRQMIVAWVQRNLPKLYEFNYANYRGKLNENLEFMRPRTLQSFQQMLEESGILPGVREDFLILRANIANEPLIVGEQVYEGVRIWLVEVPMNLIYDSGQVENNRRQRVTQRIVFRAWIARANPLQFDGGLMLAKFSVLPREGD